MDENNLNEESRRLLDIYELGRTDTLNTMIRAMEEFSPVFICAYYDEEECKLKASCERKDLSVKERLIFESFEEYFEKVLEFSECDKNEFMVGLAESEE